MLLLGLISKKRAAAVGRSRCKEGDKTICSSFKTILRGMSNPLSSPPFNSDLNSNSESQERSIPNGEEPLLTTPTLSNHPIPNSSEDSAYLEDAAFGPHPLATLSVNENQNEEHKIDRQTGASRSNLHLPLTPQRPPIPSSSSSSHDLSLLGPVIVISGGSGWNSLVSSTPSNTTHCLPVSDDGGSSSEIIRVLG